MGMLRRCWSVENRDTQYVYVEIGAMSGSRQRGQQTTAAGKHNLKGLKISGAIE